MTKPQNGNNHVSWTALGIIVTIFLVVFGWVVMASGKLGDKIDETNTNVANLKSDVIGIKTDVGWLRKLIEKESGEKSAFTPLGLFSKRP